LRVVNFTSIILLFLYTNTSVGTIPTIHRNKLKNKIIQNIKIINIGSGYLLAKELFYFMKYLQRMESEKLQRVYDNLVKTKHSLHSLDARISIKTEQKLEKLPVDIKILNLTVVPSKTFKTSFALHNSKMKLARTKKDIIFLMKDLNFITCCIKCREQKLLTKLTDKKLKKLCECLKKCKSKIKNFYNKVEEEKRILKNMSKIKL